MAATERDAQDPLEPLSKPFLAEASPIALFSALAPWLSASAPLDLAGEDNADQSESLKLQQKGQKLLVSQILWPKSKGDFEESLSLSGGVAPPLSACKAKGLTFLALSFGRRAATAAQGIQSEVEGYGGANTRWEMEEELTPREAAALMSSVPDRAGPQAPKLLQAQFFFPRLLQGCFSALNARWSELVREHRSSYSACEAALTDGTFEFVSQVVVKMSRRGQADRAANSTLLAFLRSTPAPPRTPGEIHPSGSDPSRFLDGMWHALASLVSIDAAATERWTESLLRAADKARLNDSAAEGLLWALFGRLLHSSPSVRQLFTERLLLQRVLPLRCLRWLVRFIIVNPPPNQEDGSASNILTPNQEPGRVLGQIAQVWGGPEWVRNAPLQQQSHVSAALALGISGLTKEGLEQTPGLLGSLLQGVSTRLDSPIWDTRGLGMRVATAFSMVLDPQNPLVFDEEVKVTGEEDWSWQSWNAKPSNPKKALAQLEKEEKAWELEARSILRGAIGEEREENERSGKAAERDGGATASISGRETLSGTERPRLIIGDDADTPDDIILPGAFTPKSKTSPSDASPKRLLIEELPGPPPEHEPDSDDDSVTSLEPYDMEDDVADLDGEKVPTQLRECAAALRKKEDWEGVEKALAAAEGLVRADPDELGDVSLELARALLHVRVSEFSIDGEEDQHEERRYKALVALLAHATAPVVAFLTSEVFSPHLDVHQRLLILDVLQGAAQELSGLQSRTVTAPQPPSIDQAPPPPQARNPTPWKEIDAPGGSAWSHAFERNLPLRADQKRVGKSRYWGKTDREKITRVVKNRFAPVAAAFMLPLMRDFDKRSHGVDWLGREFLVLGRFLHLLGTLVECSAPSIETQPLAAALLDLLRARAVSGHVEPYVRRQALFAAASVLMTLAPAQVIAALVGDHSPAADGLDWVRGWAAEVAENDPDEACREMGEACLQLQSNLATRAMELIQAGAPTAANPALLASLSSSTSGGPTVLTQGPRVQMLG
ncbi:protein with Telomere length regulation protein [Klebsormidium nitens]|uniref:Protein with Telomere length regulation protein n=1 Tax=Klebsormidium nitens TaxID=105231 RepID=A0A1Y1I5J2_KLENI|nr:protein with Telomere length regulation protein [Klebsormidium nitens]|eukprot:GAQ83388.1 protein with Telomere length regulation protein [Klebsormidium nitens]